MSDTPQTAAETQRRREAGGRGHVAGLIALIALFVVVAAWFWSSYQPQPKGDAGFGAPQGVMVVGAGAFVAALVAAIRASSAFEVLEAAWELLLGLFGVVGAVLKGIVNWILGLFGWD